MDDGTHLLELLDPDQHRAVQAWPLDAAQEVTVGRARTNVIVLASPLVSRQHAKLRYLESCWVVESLSELGVWCRGGLRSRLALEDGAVWSLGEHGPRLRLVRSVPQVAFDAEATIRARPETLGIGLPMLDAERRDREVAEIASSEFFQKLEQRADRLRAGRVISIHSFRGGTGKSNSTANLAVLLARQGLRVCVIDTDIQSPGIHVLFGCDPSDFKHALNDYLWGRCAIGDAAVDVTALARGPQVAAAGATPDGSAADSTGAGFKGRLFMVPSSLDAGDIARVLRDGYDAGLLGEGMRELVRSLDLDYLLIDTHPGVNEETLLSIAVSDLFLLLLRPDAQDFQGTSVTLELARRLGVAEVKVIINKVPPGIDSRGLRKSVESAYEAPVVGVLPLSSDMARLASAGIFVLRFPDHPWTLELENVARELLGGAPS